MTWKLGEYSHIEYGAELGGGGALDTYMGTMTFRDEKETEGGSYGMIDYHML